MSKLLLTLFFLPSLIFSQQVSFSLKDPTMKSIIAEVESQAELKFAYGDDVDLSTKLSGRFSYEKEELDKVLEEISRRTPYVLSIIGNNITIALDPPVKKQKPEVKKTKVQQTISGTVTDAKGAPLAFVRIQEEGTNNGVTTDATGKFAIEVSSDQSVLVFSYIGMQTERRVVGGNTTINVQLKEDAQALEEVVVVGYGTVRKSDLTGSVSSVSSDAIDQYPVPGPQLALQGKTAGVTVIGNSGAPGAPVNVRIRGSNSILGNNDPLYVVDGFALAGPPTVINPNDIQSMEVLKDASATAIYGSRGANGVVLITTKSGKAGKNTITLDSYIGFQEVSKTLEMMNAREFAEIANERAANDGAAPYFTQDQINSFSEGTNWQNELFRTAPIQNHSINFSGGGEKTQYFISGNIFDQKGVVPNSSLKKASIRANISTEISKKLALDFNANLMNGDLYVVAEGGQKGGTALSAALVGPPTISPYNENGGYNNARAYSFSPNELVNALALAKERKQNLNSKNVLLNSALTYEPIDNLKFRTSFGVETDVSRENYYSSSLLPRTPTGSGSIASTDLTNFLNENTLSYNKNFNEKHDINALVGFTYQKNSVLTYNTGSVSGFLTDRMGEFNLGAGSQTSLPASNFSNWALLSYLGRVNYSFNNTYLLTASIRSDGSSRFSEGNKWGYFPSAAFGWRILNENFMKGVDVDAISDLKLRLSWGLTGNTGINPYQTLNQLRTYSTVFNDSRYIGYAPDNNNLANPDLRWEKTSQTNVGFDLGLLANRLSLTFDYYNKDTKDLLALDQVPISTGYRNTISNVGRISNKGVELGVSAVILDKALGWTVDANFTKNRSEVISLPGGSDIFGASVPQPLSSSVNILRENEPVGVFYGYLEDGLNEQGMIKYQDLDDNGVINANDRTIIGNPNPDFTYNFTSNLTYKNFNLNFLFLGVSGNEMFNVNLSSVGNSFYFGENQLKEVYNNHWSPANPDPNAKYPKLSTKTTFSASDRFIEDGSYLRLKNIRLGYNFKLPKIGINGTLYVSGQNLLTVTNYSGYDPEVNTQGGSTSFSNGIDNLGYPASKIYTVGTTLNF